MLCDGESNERTLTPPITGRFGNFRIQFLHLVTTLTPHQCVTASLHDSSGSSSHSQVVTRHFELILLILPGKRLLLVDPYILVINQYFT